MKKWIPGLFIVVGVLVVAGIVASRAGTSRANESADVVAEAEMAGGQVEDSDQHRSTAFIGVTLAPLSEARAVEAGVDGGALLARVLKGSPADGLLLEGDIVTAIEGQTVTGPADVVETVRDSQAGDVLAFTLTRDGASVDVDVTAGERKMRAFAFRDHTAAQLAPHDAPRFGGVNGLIKSEVTHETEDGVRTIRTVVGTVTKMNVDSGEFSLTLKDGSETIEYQIDDETRVNIHHGGNLSGFNTDDLTTVVDVTDGSGVWNVKSVSQGERRGFRSELPSLRGHSLPGGLRAGSSGPPAPSVPEGLSTAARARR